MELTVTGLLSLVLKGKNVSSRHTFPRTLVHERCGMELIFSGNTDCKMYYNLSKHIYRFMGGPSKGGAGVVGPSYDIERQE